MTPIAEHRVRIEVHLDKKMAERLRIVATKRNAPVSDLVEELLTGYLDSQSFDAKDVEKQLLDEISRRFDPSVATWIREVAVFRGEKPLDTIIGHVQWGVSNGSLYEAS